MIVRLWRGRASPANAAAYLSHLTNTVFPKLATIDGFLGGRALRRETGGEVEFLVMTEWTSWQAVRAFAGNQPDVAVVEPDARAVLSHMDEHVEHFDMAYQAGHRAP